MKNASGTETVPPKMDPELKRRWVAALRSGEYKQGNCALYHAHKDAYCCLGVLARVRGATPQEIDNDASASTPKGWDVMPTDAVDRLIDFNDTRGYSFADIANWIEGNL